MDVFTIRDLRERTGELIRDAEEGKLCIVTKHGQPIFVAVPIDETLLKEGVRVALAVKLFDNEVISIGKAAKLAGMPLGEFIDYLSALKIPVVRYGKKELQRELSTFE
jgi:prevent-host-death family protein